MAQFISLNNTCLQPPQLRIHEKTKNCPFRRPYSLARPRRNSSASPNKWAKSTNLSFETAFLKGVLRAPNNSTELPPQPKTETLRLWPRKNKTRAASRDTVNCRDRIRPVMTSPELRLNMDTISVIRSGHRTSYLGRKKQRELSNEDLMNLKSQISENGKVLTLNLFDPAIRYYNKTVRDPNSWLSSDSQPFPLNKRRKRMVNPYATFTNVLKPKQTRAIAPLDFQIKPWGEEEEFS